MIVASRGGGPRSSSSLGSEILRRLRFAMRAKIERTACQRRGVLYVVSRRRGFCPSRRIEISVMAEESKIAVAAALSGNAALAVLKAFAAAVTGSPSMLAGTFHSVADTRKPTLLLLRM